MDTFFRIVFYVVSGLALTGAGYWYVQSLYRTVTRRGEVVIAPIVIVGDAEKSNRGLALAHMLHARLDEIETDLRWAQNQLMSAPPVLRSDGGRVPDNPPGNRAAGNQYPMPPQVLTQAVELHTRLLESVNIDVTVGGVQVGGLVNWVQRLMAPDPLVLTLYEGKGTAQVSGSLGAMGVQNAAIRVSLSAPTGTDSIGADALVERTAYEIVRLRLAQEPGNRVEALNAGELQTLVEVLRDTARLNRRVALGRGALPEFQEQFAKVSPLADAVPEWYQLNYLAAHIAESAKDPKSARHFYDQVNVFLSKNPKQTPLIQSLLPALASKISDLDTQLAATADAKPGTETDAPARSARERIKSYVATATNYLNAFFGDTLPVPPVQIKGNISRDGWASYWDGAKVVIPQAGQDFPDVAYREASWPHIMRVAGSEALDRKDDAETILYSYADILPMLIQQHERREDEKTSRWQLAVGLPEVTAGQEFAKIKHPTPYLDFTALGTLHQKDAAFSQVGHMRDYDTHSERLIRKYINCGIPNHAFYQAAIRIGSTKAAKVWEQALRRLKSETTVDLFRFAEVLYESAPTPERPKLKEALAAVGLDTQLTAKP